MKEFYFLNGKDQNGPFTIDELKTKNLTFETLVWSEGMENWKKIKDIPELFGQLNPKPSPPPPPLDYDTKTEVFGQLKITTEKAPNETLNAIKPKSNALTFLIIWCSFHLFALLMSYSRIKFFNDGGIPEKDKFWPFVKFTDKQLYGSWGGPVERTDFNGLFVEYDWTEFAFYVGVVLVIYFLVRISNKKN